MGIIKFLCFMLFILPAVSGAHEQWFLTPKQMMDFNSEVKPAIFTQLSTTNVSILIFTILCIYLWIKLGKGGSREIFYDHQLHLAKFPNLSALILRVATVIMLIMAVFGLNPRYEVPIMSASTLIFPDLVLTEPWEWIKYLELSIAFCFLFGIYVRIAAILLLASGILGIYLFGTAMLFYIGFVIGISLYLILQGAGLGQYPLPILKSLRSIYSFFENQPAGRAQFILRVTTGLDLALTGFICKVLHPNVTIGLLKMQHMPTFGLQMETVVFWMAIIETMAGILLCMGALTRPIAVILFFCFGFMSYAVHEPFYSHAIFYGVLMTCYLNGAGQWKRPLANDRPANIIILGGNLSGIHCAMELERLLGKYTNVKVTLVHHKNYFQYNPFLPDVIGGYVQPNNIINLLRRLCENTRMVLGNALAIDPIQQQVSVELFSRKIHRIPYDILVIANDKLLANSRYPFIDKYTMPIMNIGDALHIKEHVLKCLEQAELTPLVNQRKQLLTFTIIDGNLRGTSVAAEIKSLICSALHSYSNIPMDEISIILIEENNEILSSFNNPFARKVHNKLLTMGIEVITNIAIKKVKKNRIILTSGRIIESSTIISALSRYTLFLKEQLTMNANLQMEKYPNILMSGMSVCMTKKIPYQAYFEASLGKLAGYNAWAKSQGYSLHYLKPEKNLFTIACLGPEASTFQVKKIIMTGRFAWIITRMISLLTLPGFERNVRILVDWIFTIPFRQDITSFLPTKMTKVKNKLRHRDN